MAEHKHADVLRAIADKGFEAGEWQHSFGDWREAHDFLNPLTHPQLEWRIKPEPEPDVVVWLVQSLNGAWDEYQCYQNGGYPQIKIVRDGETGRLKSAEVLP